MTNYPHIIQRLATDDWAIMSAAYEALWTALEQHMTSANVIKMKRKDMEEAMSPGRAQPKPGGNVSRTASGVAVMDIAGVIGKRLSSMESMCGGVSVDAIVQMAESLAADPTVGTIVMNWHSPGGVVTGVPEAYDALLQVGKQKTLLSYTDTRMCSAAAWLASAATSIYSSATADTGSIGVYNMQIDRTRQLANEGIEVRAIHAGKHKLMGAPFTKLSDEQVGMLQARVDGIHSQFKSAMTRGRKVDANAMEGQVLTGAQSKAAGLVDAIYPSLRALLAAIG